MEVERRRKAGPSKKERDEEEVEQSFKLALRYEVFAR